MSRSDLPCVDEAQGLFRKAKKGRVLSTDVQAFSDCLEDQKGTMLTDDDLEWFRLIYHLLDEAESVEQARDFLKDAGTIRHWNVDHSKIREVINDLEHVGALRSVQWSSSGVHVIPVDLRQIQTYTVRLIQQRLRLLGYKAPKEGSRLRGWMRQYTPQLVIGLLVAVLGGFILYILGIG